VTATAYERLLDALDGRLVRSNQVKASARCPAHDDTNPSLAITAIEGQALIYCHAGCETVDVLAALDLTMADLYDTRRGADYVYDNGRVVHRNLDKTFPQRNTENPPELYRLAKVKAAVAAGRTVFVVEGEKDVHALEAIGVTATTNPMGAGKWPKVDASPLHGARKVVIIADRDRKGAQHASDVLVSLKEHVDQIEVVQAKRGKDAADHIAAGLGVEDFAPVDEPGSAGSRQLWLTPASEITVRPVHWLWQDRAPLGSLTLIGGREGIGQSTLAYTLAAQVTRGILPGRYYGTAKAVIVAATEDSWEHTIVPRLMAAGADLTRVYRVDVITSEDVHTELSLPRDVIAMEPDPVPGMPA
jgi:5S rRNA maturation endonuclease (ribonuclease M5)